MSNYITSQITKRLFKETVENKFGAKDPIFEYVPATRLDGRPSKKLKKQRRALPPGISEHDAQILTKVKKRAYRLDLCLFDCCGIRFGWSSVIGLIPFIGDAIDALLALMVIQTAKKVEGGLPASVLMQMYFWLMVDFGVGLVPIVGDVGDAVMKANSRNSVLLEDYLRKKGQKNLRKGGLPIPDVDPSDPDEFDHYQSESRTEYVSTQPGRHDNMQSSTRENGHRPQSSGLTAPALPTRPTPARVHDNQSKGGTFGFGRSKKSRPADVEMGTAQQNSTKKSSR